MECRQVNGGQESCTLQRGFSMNLMCGWATASAQVLSPRTLEHFMPFGADTERVKPKLGKSLSPFKHDI